MSNKATVTAIILPIKYAHIRVIAESYVTLCVPCHRTRARAITFLPVFPWRVTLLGSAKMNVL